MSAPITRVEVLGTKKFFTVFSSAPSTPIFSLWTGSGDGTCVYSATATASANGTAFHAYYTFPASRTLYVAMWVASFTAGPVVYRDYVQTIKTIPG